MLAFEAGYSSGSVCSAEDSWEHNKYFFEDDIKRFDHPAKMLDDTRPTGWIPVSERLPEDDSLTLIYDEVSQRTYLGRLEWGDWFYNGVKCYPTHWSPIPAPPEENSNSEDFQEDIYIFPS